MKSMKWDGESLFLIDQLQLPEQEEWIQCETPEDVAVAIEKMNVRGAPAIGAAAAFGIALGAKNHLAQASMDHSKEAFFEHMQIVMDRLGRTRPTAVNLFWAIQRMNRVLIENKSLPLPELVARLSQEAEAIADEDVRINRSIGAHGLELIPQNARILTHCNTGSLATVEYGTALGVIRAAHEGGRAVAVFAGETRPYLQGARLTAYELTVDQIPVTVITDSMAGHLMKQGDVDLVIVGADRIAANGDTANKIGTYSLAVLAHYHNIPFYVAAPTSTIDFDTPSGEQIEIEHRSADEVIHIAGKRMVAKGAEALHPAFDVTPHHLITAIITENGMIRNPNESSMKTIIELG